MPTVKLYTKDHCLLCDQALLYLKTLQPLHNFTIDICDIETKDKWFEKYHLTIPVIEFRGKQLLGNEVSLNNIEQFLTKNKP